MNIVKNNQEIPLVSIIVITYNSGKYVLETLESAKVQTYKNLELIVSDDASNDNTVELCKKWVKENKDRFVRTEIISAKTNSGIPANCNKGVKASTGEWLKLIAGDDVLHMNAIRIFIENISNDDNHEFYCSNYFIINEESTIIDEISLNDSRYFKNSSNSQEQFQIALRVSGTVPPLTAIYTRKMYELCGGFDESYKLLEDYPFFLKLNQIGYKAKLINKKLAYYRKSQTSVTSTNKDFIFHPIFLYTFKFQKEYCSKFVGKIESIGFNYQYHLAYIFDFLNLNSTKFRIYYNLLSKLNPYVIKRKLFGCKNKHYYINNY